MTDEQARKIVVETAKRLVEKDGPRMRAEAFEQITEAIRIIEDITLQDVDDDNNGNAPILH